MNIATFDDLLSAARAQPLPQRLLLVFAAALSGKAGRAPSSEDAEKPLQDMVEAIRMGQLQAFIPFNPQGEAVQLG